MYQKESSFGFFRTATLGSTSDDVTVKRISIGQLCKLFSENPECVSSAAWVADVFPVQAWGNSSAAAQHMVGPHEGIITPCASVVVWLRHISRRLPGLWQEMRDTLQGKSPRSRCQPRPFHNRPGIMHIPVKATGRVSYGCGAVSWEVCQKDDLDRSHVWAPRAPRTLFKHTSLF